MRLTATLLSLGAAVHAVKVSSGWLPCPLRTGASLTPDTNYHVGNTRCATLDVPLCYDGVCTSDKTISVFVKHYKATKPPAHGSARQALWFLQGGPGASSIVMESYEAFAALYFNGTVDVYTMDHRGTGKSTYLECATTEAAAVGSPGGQTIDPSEMAACIENVRQIYGNDTAAGWSSTSAAKDVASAIEVLTPDAETYVYGVSYGTLWVRRLMQLSPPTVKGYILDGIAGPFSSWNRDTLTAVDRFWELCGQDKVCASKLGSNPKATVEALYAALDDGTNSCAELFGASPTPPSWTVRQLLRALLQAGVGQQELIPALVYRFQRCSSHDVQWFAVMLGGGEGAGPIPAESANMVDHDESELLHDLVSSAELWETPSRSELQAEFLHSTMAFDLSLMEDKYCVITGATDPACTHVARPNTTYTYTRDKFAKLKPTPTTNASVILFSGLLDVQTPHMHATALYDALALSNATKKALFTFPYSGHGALTRSMTPTDPSCAMRLLRDFVLQRGDVSKIERSCLNDLVPTTFVLNAMDIYEGKAPEDEATTREVIPVYTVVRVVEVLLAGSGLIIIALVVAIVVLALKLRRARKARNGALSEEAHLLSHGP
ncbi:hypothetical protein SDRG_04945 [Saprolegnia diclina VS20]|uniref:AB hydrolase-1 domain-containing protein n=1 Tax=Saprolegnia diclina (strain VS20) TaxID=1156394 RepID=T0RZ50_SAPDV|nr:hypothetical protein SDRG_04945 [Saprolegnia diclina VS20]EQC37928.1 hypothetical protein SDRG_04945 [Saprolegnia diclina VS20]|eukprot:XP_008608861.1 hypothetical protein SDRG_04945 [Saprolegnia diclina VS20]